MLAGETGGGPVERLQRRLTVRQQMNGTGRLLLAATIGYWMLAVLAVSSSAAEPGWQAGAARAAITPKQPMWMSGYASRTRPSEGAVHDLWAKALALKD